MQNLSRPGAVRGRRAVFALVPVGTQARPDPGLRYQLLHRFTSAVLEARRWRFPTVLMLVQSFAELHRVHGLTSRFGSYLGIEVLCDVVSGPVGYGDVALYLAWANSTLATDEPCSGLTRACIAPTPVGEELPVHGFEVEAQFIRMVPPRC